MASLAVRKVSYWGDKYEYDSPPLGDGLNLLVGENGTGKSTFANLVYYGLGGQVDSFRKESSRRHAEVANDTNNHVALHVSLGKQQYILKRYIGTSDIGVDGEDTSAVYPLTRGPGREYTFSDWFLCKLGIEPVMLQFGSYTGKLNLSDLLRLVYHNQEPDPTGVFKPVDGSTLVSDSRVFRKAIFEMLVGKSYQEYYSTLASYRTAERKRVESTKALEMFREMVAQLSEGHEDWNIVFIEKQLEELAGRRIKLLSYRDELAKAPQKLGSGTALVDLQRALLESHMKISALGRRESELLEELSQYEQLRTEMMLEATQIRKMMFAHENLQLFTSNTCPYCLHEVQRVPNKCVCGRDVSETDYEKFFYDTEEYLSIVKSRQKNVETVVVAIADARSELEKVRSELDKSEVDASSAEGEITRLVRDSGSTIDLAEFDMVDEKLSKLRAEISKLEQQLVLETKRDALELDRDSTDREVKRLEIRVRELEAAAEGDIAKRRDEFEAIYSGMMKKTVAGCRTASLDADYMPMINGGEYREASAAVPRRLLYFATLLKMSRIDADVRFPRFLLIDTPETAGIDQGNLRNAIACVSEVAAIDPEVFPCQVILTTGVDKYPEGLNGAVFTRLSVNEKLLRPRSVQKLNDTKSL